VVWHEDPPASGRWRAPLPDVLADLRGLGARLLRQVAEQRAHPGPGRVLGVGGPLDGQSFPLSGPVLNDHVALAVPVEHPEPGPWSLVMHRITEMDGEWFLLAPAVEQVSALAYWDLTDEEVARAGTADIHRVLDELNAAVLREAATSEPLRLGRVSFYVESDPARCLHRVRARVPLLREAL
jgi:hypothetical protein